MKGIWHYNNGLGERQAVAQGTVLGPMMTKKIKTEVTREPVTCESYNLSRTRFSILFLFAREEPRIHVHVRCAHGDAKFWLEPHIELAENYGLNSRQISTARRLIEEHADEIKRGWQDHFRS